MKGNVLATQNLMDLSFGNVPVITSAVGIKESQIQMATVDCSLGNTVHRMKASALPSKGETVKSLIEKFSSYSFRISPEGSYLEKGACYVAKLNESFNLPQQFFATFSPKSSTGRLDVFVRVLGDGMNQYDRICAGYKGPLYLEIIPLSFGVKVTPGLEMTQFRIKSQRDFFLTDSELAILHSKHSLLFWKNGDPLGQSHMDIADNSVFLHADLNREIVGWEARTNSVRFINMSKTDNYSWEDFWLPISNPTDGQLILEPGKFYLLATEERIKIPTECCAEMLPYDVSSGEFRSHYAGFFDNGFGGETGTTAVLEVRVRDIPHRIVRGQRVCRMVFERTTSIPSKLYGNKSGSNYTSHRAALSKHFKDKDILWGE